MEATSKSCFKMLEKCVTIKAYLMFSNYMAFYPSHVTPLNHPVISNLSICDTVTPPSPSTMLSSSSCKVNPGGEVIWENVANVHCQ